MRVKIKKRIKYLQSIFIDQSTEGKQVINLIVKELQDVLNDELYLGDSDLQRYL